MATAQSNQSTQEQQECQTCYLNLYNAWIGFDVKTNDLVGRIEAIYSE